ncbi:MAG: SpoIID/LytB domain-containing protein [Blastocatellales bacterium]
MDDALQRVATSALGEREGAVIVVDPQTGRLRAVVNPRLAYEQAFPPGSAIKPFTALAALRAGLLDLETRRQCQTKYARAGFEIVCSHPRSKTPFNLTQALAYSCNDYFAHVGERLSEGTFNATIAGFGFGERTGISASEVSGSLPHGEWRVQAALGDDDKFLTTPIQLIMAYAALVNGGRLYRPRQTTDQASQPQEIRRLSIQPNQRAALLTGMRGAVKYGTAEKAKLGDLPFYVFGKTGTSTASNGFRTQGWFVGFAAESRPVGVPAPEDVKLGVLVFLKRAHGSQAAEVARTILNCVMRNAECGGDAESNRNPVSFTETNTQSVKVRSISENTTRELPMEEYLVGVLAGEASVEKEFEALKAQAVISRTFAARNRGRHAREAYDFCSTTHCQRFVVPNERLHALARRAVAATRGEILRDRSGQPADVYFHAACGGVTANIETLWGVEGAEYLRGVRDDFCALMPHRKWQQTISAAELAKALQSDEQSDVGSKLKNIIVSKRDATGRAEWLTIEGERNRRLRGWDFKMIVGRVLGWQMIKSSRFDVSRRGDSFVFRGSGFGHGLGLCQEGAHVMAVRKMNYRQILSFYFPQTRLMAAIDENPKYQLAISHQPLTINRQWPDSGRFSIVLTGSTTGDRGNTGKEKTESMAYPPIYPRDPSVPRGFFFPYAQLQTDLVSRPVIFNGELPVADFPHQSGSIINRHFRVNFGQSNDKRDVEQALKILEAARKDLLNRLRKASLRLDESSPFEIVIHSTTAEFIAATGLSGWAAGATRGRRIEFQPLQLLQKRRALATTLRHELTHSVIELLGGGLAPRWLAEGLAIHFAGEGAAMQRIAIKDKLTRDQLERRLAMSGTAAQMRELYTMAHREVQALIRQRGEAFVWQLVTRSKEKAGRAQ